MDILYILLILLIVSRVFGEAAERLRQPSLVGELLAGILLGGLATHYRASLPVLANLEANEVFTALTDLGIFFLMLYAGLELRPREFAKATKGAMPVALGGMVVPLVLGFGFGWLSMPDSQYRFAQSLFIGTALAITAVPVAARVLMDMGKLKTGLGQLIISAAVVDDVLSLLLLAILTGVLQTGEMPGFLGVMLITGKVILFFAVATLVGRYLFPLIGKRLWRTKADQFDFSMVLVAAMAYAELAELLDMHFILGAFMAGLFVSHRTVDSRSYDETLTKIKGLATGFLAPIFFASVGMHLDLTALFSIPGKLAALLLLAIVGKVAGAGLVAWFSGRSTRDALTIGFAMNARGAVELIVADVALKAGLFSVPEPAPPDVRHLFSAIVIMAIVTTLLTPLVLRALLRGER